MSVLLFRCGTYRIAFKGKGEKFYPERLAHRVWVQSQGEYQDNSRSCRSFSISQAESKTEFVLTDIAKDYSKINNIIWEAAVYTRMSTVFWGENWELNSELLSYILTCLNSYLSFMSISLLIWNPKRLLVSLNKKLCESAPYRIGSHSISPSI